MHMCKSFCGVSRICEYLWLHLDALLPSSCLLLQFQGGGAMVAPGFKLADWKKDKAKGPLLSKIKPCTVTEGNQLGSHWQILCISFIKSGHRRADRQVRPKDLWTQLKLYHKEIKFMWFTFQKVTFGGLSLLLFCNLMQTMWTFETLLTVKPAQITQNQSSNKEWIKTDCNYSQFFFPLKEI